MLVEVVNTTFDSDGQIVEYHLGKVLQMEKLPLTHQFDESRGVSSLLHELFHYSSYAILFIGQSDVVG